MNRTEWAIFMLVALLFAALGLWSVPGSPLPASNRLEYAEAAAKREYKTCYSDGEPTTPAEIDVRSKWEGATKSVFILALNCRSCDVNEVYVVIASDNKKETKVIHIDTED